MVRTVVAWTMYPALLVAGLGALAVTLAVPAAATLPLTKPTLDSGLWAVNLQAALADQDGSETLEVRVAGVPVGLGFNQGTNLGGGVWSFTPAQLAGLSLTGPASWSQDLALTVTAISRETATGATAASAPIALPIVVNARPTDITGALSVNENAANGTAVGSVAGIDADAGESFSYALLDNAGGRFAINAATGQITIANGSLLNYEAAASHAINVRVVDSGGLTRDEAFTVTLNNVNETPTGLAFSNVVGSLAEDVSTAAATRVADFSYADDALGAENLTLSGADAGLFHLSGGSLFLNAGVALNYEARSSYAVTVNVDDPGVGANPDLAQSFTLNIADVNETPWLNATTLSVPESIESAGPGTPVGKVYFVDPDNTAPFNTMSFALSGAGAANFSVGAQGSDAGGRYVAINYSQGSLDYETAQRSYNLTLTGVDRNGAGLVASAPLSINVTDVNEAPRLTGATVGFTGGGMAQYYHFMLYMSVSDPEGNANAISLVRASDGAQIGTSGIQSAYLGYFYASVDPSYQLPVEVQGLYNAVLSDSGGATRNATITITSSYQDVLIAPIVLDLDGDGLELTNVVVSRVNFDQDSDGEADPTGWVGADDGLLVIDHNGNGVIDNGGEIAFSNHVDFAVSDLEGLRAYDTNANGVIDAGDAEFAALNVWQDANQDGVSQASELTTLAQRNIASIGLTLTPTVQGLIAPLDNVVYGTGAYVRTDGSVGTVGDVMLAYVDASLEVLIDADAPAPTSGTLAPIVLDLDGDGVALVERDASMVAFDANGDGTRERTGWFSAGDGVLAFDRNFSGVIDSGLEISFLQDVQGATSDLEGLAAFDADANGRFDAGDAWFGAFQIWQDANQDGVSQRGELRSLGDHGITAIGLTRANIAPGAHDGENAILGYGYFIRSDGSVGEFGDVSLAFGESTPTTDDSGSRTADDRGSRRPTLNGGGGGGGGANPVPRDDNAAENEDEAAGLNQRLRRVRERGRAPQRGNDGLDRAAPTLFDSAAANENQAEPMQAILGAPRSALHSGLGVMDRKLLGMIDAMAQFEASSAADLGLGRKKLDPRVAELLTALPDIR